MAESGWIERNGVKCRHGRTFPHKEGVLLCSEVSFVDGSGKTRSLRFSDTGRVSRKRVETLLTKEPTTIEWLESFAPGEVFYDVGANVGMYTVYAASRGTKVYAFEPESLNYAELNKNLFLNSLHDKARAYCLAASDAPALTDLYLSAFTPAYSHHDCGERRWDGPVTKLGPSAEARLPQGCVAVRLSDVVKSGLPSPSHVKIDVDGLEGRVIKGAEELLSRPGLKSILVETDFALEDSRLIRRVMEHWGWKFSYAQVCRSSAGRVTPEEWEMNFAAGRGGCNIIYFREDSAAFYGEVFRW